MLPVCRDHIFALGDREKSRRDSHSTEDCGAERKDLISILGTPFLSFLGLSLL
jgi:hypothetical protein